MKKTRLCWRVLKLAWQARPGSVLIFMIGAVLQTAATILTIYASAQLAALLARYVTGQSTDKIWFWMIVDIVAAVIIGLSFWMMNYAKRLLYFRLTSWSIHHFFYAMSRLDMPDFYKDEVRNLINKAHNGYSWQMPNLAHISLDLIYALIRFGAIALVVAQITWWLIPLVAFFLIPSLIAEAREAKVQWFIFDKKGDERHVFWTLDWLIRQPYGQFELRSSQARRYVSNKIDKMNQSFYAEQEHKFKQISRLTAPSKIVEVAGVIVGSITLIRQFLNGAISFDRYLFLSGALLRIVAELNNIFGTLTRMQEPLLFAENYFELIDRQPKHIDKKNAVKLKARRVPKIIFENVTFTYPGQSTPVFNDLNLTIEPGQHVAIVGENGAGKSTLIKLLMRFYKPDSGRILINDVDLEDIAIETWYEQIATLFQSFNQYPFPIHENIEIARPAAKDDKKRLQEAADLGGVSEMVNEYKYGWETVLNSSFKQGIEPSGGQWQRVALARAFYRHANVLILDEPTAAIDASAEYEIFNNIFDSYKDKSVIIISHRFSTVRRANKIIVIDEGKIIEQGSHSELIKQKGLYKEMFSKQAEGYKD